MNKELEDALNNVTIVVGQARMNAQEHMQLAKDLNLIRDKLTTPLECEPTENIME